MSEPYCAACRRTEIEIADEAYPGWVATYRDIEAVGISREEALISLVATAYDHDEGGDDA